jgi:hypothetical protein
MLSVSIATGVVGCAGCDLLILGLCQLHASHCLLGQVPGAPGLLPLLHASSAAAVLPFP